VIAAIWAWSTGAIVMAWALPFFDGAPSGWQRWADYALAVMLWPVAIVVLMVRR
jgi:hypothetical protein